MDATRYLSLHLVATVVLLILASPLASEELPDAHAGFAQSVQDARAEYDRVRNDILKLYADLEASGLEPSARYTALEEARSKNANRLETARSNYKVALDTAVDDYPAGKTVYSAAQEVTTQFAAADILNGDRGCEVLYDLLEEGKIEILSAAAVAISDLDPDKLGMISYDAAVTALSSVWHSYVDKLTIGNRLWVKGMEEANVARAKAFRAAVSEEVAAEWRELDEIILIQEPLDFDSVNLSPEDAFGELVGNYMDDLGSSQSDALAAYDEGLMRARNNRDAVVGKALKSLVDDVEDVFRGVFSAFGGI